MKNWSLIIFCYNEENSIINVIQDAHHFLIKNTGDESEIILVDDGSSDNTLKNAQSQKLTVPELKIIHLEKNQGIGNALNTGYNLAKGEYICAVPGDGQFDINELSLFGEIPENKFIAYYRPQKNYSLYRSYLTWGNHFFNKYFLGIDFKDANWIKVYTKEQLQSVTRELNSSLVESEIVAKLMRRGYQPQYFPSKYLDRENGSAKGGSIRTLMKAVRELYLLKKVVKT